jgi:hypothetical protein
MKQGVMFVEDMMNNLSSWESIGPSQLDAILSFACVLFLVKRTCEMRWRGMTNSCLRIGQMTRNACGQPLNCVTLGHQQLYKRHPPRPNSTTIQRLNILGQEEDNNLQHYNTLQTKPTLNQTNFSYL